MIASAQNQLAALVQDAASAYLRSEIEKRKKNNDLAPVHSYPGNGLPKREEKPLIRPTR